MKTEPQESNLSPLAQQGRTLYENKLKAILEPEHNGRAVAIHVDSEDYAVADTHSNAARSLLQRHKPDGRIVTLTIGPPTETDRRLTYRILAGQKQ
jgi:hypothetical protein